LFSTESIAIHHWHHEINENEIGKIIILKIAYALKAIHSGGHAVPFALEKLYEELPDRGIIFDH
jgi:hypothetical protein